MSYRSSAKSSIRFGDGSDAASSSSPTAAAAGSPTIKSTAPAVVTSPSQTGKRYGPYSKSSIFDQPDPLPAASPMSPTRTTGISSLNLAESPAPAKGKKPGPRSAAISNIVFGGEDVAPPPPRAAKKSENPILPSADSTTHRPGKRPVEGSPHFRSNFSLAHDTTPSAPLSKPVAAAAEPAAPQAAKQAAGTATVHNGSVAESLQHKRGPAAAAAAASPILRSSVVLGDDGGSSDSLNAKKPTGKRRLPPPGGSNASSFAEFAGAPTQASDPNGPKMIQPTTRIY
ncbi:hypothetical protein DFJ73DRAFT_825228 [Zopfochytrium polystomum]|nr:hypothetical protein DFJ73DRAFT_825228 [Zopfochytrium polystomum]